MASWQAQSDVVQQLSSVLEQSTSPHMSIRTQANKALQDAGNNPDICKYLVYLLVTQSPNEVSATRATAGLWLKNILTTKWFDQSPETVSYVKNTIHQGLVDKELLIRNISSIVLTTLFSRIGADGWPQLFEGLIQMIETGDDNAQDGSLRALSKICEDSASEFEKPVIEGHVSPMSLLVPRLIKYCGNQNRQVRSNAVFCLTQFVALQSQDFLIHLDDFLQALFTLASDDYCETKRNVAVAFKSLFEIRPDRIAPHIEGIVNFCLHCIVDDDEQVALEGAEFILTIAESEMLDHAQMQTLIPAIVPVILRTMVYSENDIMILENLNENDQEIADRAEDIKPVHNKTKDAHHVKQKGNQSKSSGSGGDKDDEDDDATDDEDDDLADALDEWNLRKCSAASLDALSMKYASEILVVAQPHLLERINSPQWAVRESAVLAFGAIAQGCLNTGADNFTAELVPFLIKLLRDEHAQIREISCWTVSRYGGPVVCNSETLQCVLEGLMHCALDHNKKVQEAGCSAISVIADLAGEALMPYVEPLLEHFRRCFAKYQQKSMIALYDCIQTCVAAFPYAMSEPRYVQMLMEPLAQRWQLHEDNDREFLPLLECLSAVAAVSGRSFQPYAEHLFGRTINIIKQNLLAGEQFRQDPENFDGPEKEFLVCSLDLIDGIVQGLQETCIPLFEQYKEPSFLDMVQHCFNDDTPEVRQSCFALIGDMAIYVYSLLQPQVDRILVSLISNIDYTERHMDAVCNNAMWATGEISLHVHQQMEPFFNELFPRLVNTLMSDSVPTLLENAAIVIGRLGLALPAQVASHMQSFIAPWIMVMDQIEETDEKDTALQGMCQAIAANPSSLNEEQLTGLFSTFSFYLDPSLELNKDICSVLAGYKQLLSPQQFETLLSKLDPNARMQLETVYSF